MNATVFQTAHPSSSSQRAFLRLLLCAGFALAAAAAFGQAPSSVKADGFVKADGLENWDHDFDTSKLPAGTYNIIVKGKDSAGNTQIAGPINVRIDPASALPVVSIINPTSLQRVGGDLIVVGTCAAEAGVARVEVRIDGGEYQPAQGAEFWSLSVPTKDIPEGRKTLEVRGVDTGGLVGKPVKVVFDLDRTEPAASVASPQSGALVAGRIRIQGTVSSANGIASLESSTDGAKTFVKAALGRGKQPDKVTFALDLDTKKFPDGPRIIWLRSVDRVGVKGSATFLIFVANTKPEVKLHWPAPGAVVHGRFSLAASVRSAIGVAKLDYQLEAGKKTDIPLTPGDSYFALEFDARGIKGDRANIIITAQDRIGNITRYPVSLKIDHQAEKPVLKVTWPAPAGKLSPGQLVWGSITADDGGAGIRVTVDGGKPQEFPASDVFSYPLASDLASGKHVLSLQAKDAYGTWGTAVSLPVTFVGGPPAVKFLRLAADKGGKGAAGPYVPGMSFKVDGGSWLEGSLASANTPAKVSYAVAGGAERKLEVTKAGEAGSFAFRIPLDRSMPYGFVPIEVRGEDTYGQAFTGKALLYSVDLSSDREDTGFRFDDPRIGGDGRVALAPGDPLLGAFYREEIESLRLDPPTDLVSLSFEGRVVRVESARPGLTRPERIVARTKGGHEFSSDPFVFACGDSAPTVSMDSPAEGAWFAKGFTVSGTVSDAGGPEGMTVTLGSGDRTRAVSLSSSGRFSVDLLPAELAPGPGILDVAATNAAGRVSHAYRSYGFSPDPPKVQFLSPEAGAEVSGPEDVAASLSDASGVVSVEYADDGATFAPIDRKGAFFIHRADLAAHPAAAYRVTDRAGNVAVERPDVKVVARPAQGAASDKVDIEPVGDEPRVELTGVSGLRKLSVVVPGLSETDFSALGSAAGAAGSASPEARPRFAPRLLVSGSLALKGSAASDAKIKSIGLSTDGGATYAGLFLARDEKSQLATVPVALSIDSTKLPDGEARWVLRIEDGAGTPHFAPIYATVDNTKPQVAFLTPAGGTFGIATPVILRVRDNVGLAGAAVVVGQDKRALPLQDGGAYYAIWAEPGQLAKSGAQTGALALSVEAVDAAGNSAVAQARYALDPKAGAPRLDLSLPPSVGTGADKSAPPIWAADGALRGTASGAEGIASLSVSMDGGEPVQFPAGTFSVSFSPFSPGRHALVAEARTEGGRVARVKKDFIIAGPAPRISSINSVLGKGSTPWTPGAAITLAAGAGLAGTIQSSNGIVSVEYRVNNGSAQKASTGKPAGSDVPFACVLPSALPYDRFVVEVSVKDAAGLETKRRYDFHNVLPPLPGAAAADTAVAIRFFDDHVTDAAAGRLLRLGPSETLVGSWNGRPLKTVAVLPSTPLLDASFEGGRITLTAKGAGVVMSPAFRLHAETVDGDAFEWGPFGVATRSAPPSLSLRLPENDAWTRGSVRIAGSAEASNGVLAVEASINGGGYIALSQAAPPAAASPPPAEPSRRATPSSPPGSPPSAPRPPAASAPSPQPAPPPAGNPTVFPFDSDVPLEQAADGAFRLDVRVRDVSGDETIVTRFLNKDTVPPVVQQISPLESEEVTGPTTVIGQASDAGHVASIQFLPSKDGTPQEASGKNVFSSTLDLARLPYPLPEGGGFLVVDRAGNSTLFAPKLQVNAERGKPVVEIQAPVESQIIRSDFSISGTAFDYAGVSKVFYRVDGSDWKSIEPKDAGFSIPVTLESTTDNEHLFEAYAENINGIKGDVTSRTWRVSKEEPRASMAAPDIAKPVRGIIDISGTSSDANGIDFVSLSFDNGATYVKAIGAETWHYPLDTRILKDGLHAVTIKPVDKYGTVGFSASLITVDNTAPQVQLAQPRDGALQSGSVEVSGRVSDNFKLASVRVELIPIGQDKPPALTVDLGQSEVVRTRLDVSSLAPGPYTLRLIGRDRADNEALASHDIVLSQERPADKVDLFHPVEGQDIFGRLRLYGRATIAGGASTVTILSDGADVGSAPLSAQGYFAFDIPADSLTDGSHTFSARGVGADSKVIESRRATVAWKAEGPWLTVDSLALGGYRPWLSGKAGWAAVAPDPKDTAAAAAFRRGESGRKVVKVEVSLDNGRSFQQAGGRETWRYRLETQNYSEGGIFLLVRGTFGDGSVVVTKTMFSLDKTPPTVRILVPPENSRFGSHIRVAGTASDDESGLASVELQLRKGDKRGYELPAFIQGLYLDAHVFGATTWEAGLGLSFFDDNVKLQAMYGQAPATDENGAPQRFFGNVYAAKLIANLFYLPFSSVLGPDWDAFSASLSLGAEFSYFDMNGTTDGKVLSGVVAQLEFPKFTLKQLTFLKKYSLYLEEEAWFVSSDVPGASTILFRTTLGLRLGLF